MCGGGGILGGIGSFFGPVGMLVGGLVGSMLGGQQQQPQMAQAPAAPQSSKSPTAASIQGTLLGTGQAGGAPGAAQTLLTGPGGIDPKTLNLGKSTLLGQ